MAARVLILLRARLAAQKGDAALPVAALLVQAFVASVVCGLVRGALPPFAYGLVALSTSAALVAIPLLGELARLLVADESGDWVRALPVRPVELHLARTLHLVIELAVLSMGALLPAALLAGGFSWAQRAELVALGLGQSLMLAAALLGVQALLRGRAQPLLVAAQTALFLAVLVGASIGLRKVPEMAAWSSPSAGVGLALFPPAWFAAALSSDDLGAAWRSLAPALTALAALVLFALPAPESVRYRRGEPLAALALGPLRRLLARLWVRDRERASYEWLFDALPRERDFVIRTYPLLAVPAAFLWISAKGESPADQQGWLALLLFIPGAYVPLLAAHVPGSDSHRARWLIDCAPIERDALDNGAVKAVAVRFLVPFYALLAVLGALLGGVGLVARLALPALLSAVIVLRATWRTCVTSPPLSTAPDELYINRDWLGMLAVIASVLSVVAVLAARWVQGPLEALAFAAAVLGLEIVLDRRRRAGLTAR